MIRISDRAQLALILGIHAVVGSCVFRFGTDLQDEGLIYATAKRIADGQLPYTDFYLVQAPGTFYIHAAFIEIFGPSLIVGRIFKQVQGLALVALSYAVTREATGNRRAGVIAALATATFSAAHHYRMPWYGTDACLALLLGAWLACLSIRRGRAWLAGAAGCALGLTALFKQNHGVFGLAAIGVILGWTSWRASRVSERKVGFAELLAPVAALFAGFVATFGAYLAYYVAAGGSLTAMWLNCLVWAGEAKDFPSLFSMLLYPLSVFSLVHKADWRMPLTALVLFAGLACLLAKRAPQAVRWLGALVALGTLATGPDVFIRIYILSFVNLLIFVIALAALVEAVRSRPAEFKRSHTIALLALVAAANTYGGAIPGGGWGRMVETWGASLVAFGVGAHLIHSHGGLVQAWWSRTIWPAPRSVGYGLAVTSLVVSLGLLAKNQAFRPRLDVGMFSMTGRAESEGWRGIRGDPIFVSETDEVVGALRALPPDAGNSLYVFPLNCALYVFADRENPTQFDSHQIDFLAPSRFEVLLAQLEATRPAAIVYQLKPNASSGAGPEPDDSWVRDPIRSSVLTFLRANYQLARKWNYYQLWLPRL